MESETSAHANTTRIHATRECALYTCVVCALVRTLAAEAVARAYFNPNANFLLKRQREAKRRGKVRIHLNVRVDGHGFGDDDRIR